MSPLADTQLCLPQRASEQSVRRVLVCDHNQIERMCVVCAGEPLRLRWNIIFELARLNNNDC